MNSLKKQQPGKKRALPIFNIAELARQLGCSRSHLSNILAGRKKGRKYQVQLLRVKQAISKAA